jgi:hypothetical protein
MVRLFIFMFMLGYFCTAQAQNLTGKWVGYFTTNTGISYSYEVNIEDDGSANLTASTFTKFSNINSAKASAKGQFSKSSKLVSILETKFDQVTISPNTQACLMNNYLTYYNVNGREILQGTYISNNLTGKNDCGTGTVVLTKEITFAVVKKANKPSNKLIKKDKDQLVEIKQATIVDTVKTTTPKQSETVIAKVAELNSNPNITSTTNNDLIPVTVNNNRKKKFVNMPWLLISRDNKLIKTLITKNSKISIDLVDNGSFESDSISIYDNNVLLFDHIKLSYKEFHFDVNFSNEIQQHELVLVAHKTGNNPRNSSIIIYKDNDIKEEFIISANNKTNAKIIVKQAPKEKTSSD